MNRDRNASRRARPGLCAEPLEGRTLLTVAFYDLSQTVSDTAGEAEVVLQNADYGSGWGPETVRFTTTGGGNAVPGVDFQPVDGVVIFGPGEVTKSVAVPVLKADPSAGNKVVKLSLTSDSQPGITQTATLRIAHSPDVTGPKVESTRVVVSRGRVQAFVVTFDEAMDRASVENAGNYVIFDPRSMRPARGRQGGRTMGHDITFASATYDDATHSLTLVPAGKVRPAPLFILMNPRLATFLRAMSSPTAPDLSAPDFKNPAPITDVVGNPLAGNGPDEGDLFTVATYGHLSKRVAGQLAVLHYFFGVDPGTA